MLEQWFDVSKKIPKEELELALDQMMLYAYKDGLDPNSKDVKEELRNFKKTVQKHNKRFPVDFNKNIKNINSPPHRWLIEEPSPAPAVSRTSPPHRWLIETRLDRLKI